MSKPTKLSIYCLILVTCLSMQKKTNANSFLCLSNFFHSLFQSVDIDSSESESAAESSSLDIPEVVIESEPMVNLNWQPEPPLNCLICLKKIKIDQINAQYQCIPCGHVYHVECIETWLRKRNNCPSCHNLVDRLNLFIKLKNK